MNIKNMRTEMISMYINELYIAPMYTPHFFDITMNDEVRLLDGPLM